MSFFLGKILEFCFTSFIAILCLFLLLYFMPGDPFYESSGGSGNINLHNADFSSLSIQFWQWIINLLHGDLGWSALFNRPVSTILFPALKNSLMLVIIGLSLTLLMAYFLSILAALFRGSFLSTCINSLALLSISIPTFWLCILFLGLFLKTISLNQTQHLLNSSFGINSLFAILIFTLTHVGVYTHHFKTQLDSTLRENYIKTAKAKGASRLQILIRHASLPSIFPFLGMMSITLGQIFNGQLIIEILFDYPGMGRLLMESILNNDIPLAAASILTTIFAALFASFLLTLLEHYILPYHHLALGEKNAL